MPKFVIAVMSCLGNKAKRDVIRSTWGQTSHVPVLFYVGSGEPAAELYTYQLNCPDDYKHCALKQFEMMRHLDYECPVFFCDDDTYIVTDRLKLPESEYVGCPCVMEDGTVMAHGGAGFFLGTKALKLATEENRDLCSETIYSDQLVGKLMKRAGIELQADFRFNPGKYRDNVGYCNLVPNRRNQYITTHFVPEDLMHSLHRHFYGKETVPNNIYEMTFNANSVVILENEGQWFCTPKVSTEMFGPFELAQHAEDYALRNFGLPSTL